MSIKVEASRFAVLKVEDDDQTATKAKAKQTGNNQGSNNKNKNKSSKNKISGVGSNTGKPNIPQSNKNNNTQTSVKVNLQNANKSANQQTNNSNLQTTNTCTDQSSKSKKVEDQWDQWKEMDEKFVEKEFNNQLKQVLIESKKEAQAKSANLVIKTNDDSSNKKNKKVFLTETNIKNDIKESKEIKSEALKKEDTISNLSVEDKLEIKNQSIIEIKKVIEKLEFELGDYKIKNQKLCQYLLQGEACNVSDLEREIIELRNKHKIQTEKLTQLSTDLEKERSKGHVLKSELNKLKTHKEAAAK